MPVCVEHTGATIATVPLRRLSIATLSHPPRACPRDRTGPWNFTWRFLQRMLLEPSACKKQEEQLVLNLSIVSNSENQLSLSLLEFPRGATRSFSGRCQSVMRSDQRASPARLRSRLFAVW